MADAEQAVAEKTDEAEEAVASTVTERPSDAQVEETAKPKFLGKYDSTEEAEKAFVEIQARATRAEQASAVNAAKLEMLERAQNPNTSEAQKAKDAEIMELLDAKPREALRLMRDMGMDVLDISRRELNALESKLRKEFEDRLESVDPEVAKNREAIDRFAREYDIPREKAKQIVLKELRTNGVVQPPRMKPPAKPASERSGEGGGDGESVALPAALEAEINAFTTLSAKDKAELRKELSKTLKGRGK